MIRSTLIVLSIALSCCSAQVILPWDVRGRSSIQALEQITNCGVGQLVDVRFEGCARAPCTLSKGQAVNLQVDFRPRDFHCCLTLRSILLQDSTLVSIANDVEIPNATVQPGQQYTFNFPFTVPASSFSGRGEFRMIVFQNYVQEICLVVPVNIV